MAEAKIRLALSVRQPSAELILRGEKLVEYRSRPTHVRGRIYIYVSKRRYSRAEEADWGEQYALDVDRLPRGMIVGTVELFDCYGDEWRLRLPRRFARPIKPERRPNPVWFRPF